MLFSIGDLFGQCEPVLNIIGESTVCSGSSVLIIVEAGTCDSPTPPDGPYEYFWSGGSITTPISTDDVGQLDTPALNNPTPNSTDITITVTVEDSDGTVVGSDDIVVTVLPAGTANIDLNSPVSPCIGDNVVLSATYSGGSGTPESYVWSPEPDSQAGPNATYNDVDEENPSYQVTITDSEGCTASTTQSFTINALPPTPSIAGGDVGLCTGEALELNLSGSSNNLSCVWRKGGVEVASPGCSVNISPAQTSDGGNYTVEVEDDNGCAAESQPISVTVSPPLNISITPSETDVCENGDIVELTLSPAPAALSNPSLTISSSPDALDTDDFEFLPEIAGPGMYTITYTGTSGFCTNSASTTITVLETPDAQIVGSSPEAEGFCAGEEMTLTSTVTGGDLSCSWSLEGAPTADVTCQLSREQLLLSDAGMYTLTVTDTDNGCVSDPATFTVEVDELNVSITSSAPSSGVCTDGDDVELNLVPAQGVSDEDNLSFDPDFPEEALNGLVIDPEVAGEGSYVFTYDVTEGACSKTATTTVVILPTPVVETSSIPQVCNQNSSIDLSDFVSPSGGVFTFLDNTEFDGSLNPVDTTDNAFLDFTYTVTLPTGCSSSIQNSLFVNPELEVSVEDDFELCVGGSGSLGAVATGGGNNYTFSWNNAALIDNENSQFPNLVENIPIGAYNFQLTVNDQHNCTTTATQNLQIRGQAVVAITSVPDDVFCVGDSLLLKATFASGVGEPRYFWQGDPSPMQPDSFQTGPILQDEEFTVTLVFPPETGCDNRVEEKLFAPAPTPNPSILSATLSDANTVCNNEASIYFAQDRVPGTTLTWAIQGANQNIDSTNVDDDFFYVYWSNNLVGTETILLEEFLSEECQETAELEVTFSGSNAPPPAELFLSSLNGILVYNQSDLCYRWGFIDPNANVNANPPESYLNFDLNENTFQSFIIGDLDTTLTYFCQTWFPGDCEDVGGSCSTTIVYEPKNNSITQPPPKEKAGFAVFPNPNTGNFNFKIDDLIENRNYNWELRNSLGQIIDSGDFVPSGSDHSESLSIQNQAQGIYLLTISDGINILKVSRVSIQN